jgi:N-acetylglucosaminyldiphosphoundecaprenol N-acetyl-beta-D-mannosaminyltransferase
MATEVVVLTGSPSVQTLLPPSPQRLLRGAAYSPGGGTPRRRLELGGTFVDQIDLVAAVERIEQFLRSGEPHQVVTVNMDFLSIAARDPEFRATINSADLAVADGMPLVWLSRLRGQPLAERVAGVELVTESCRIAAEQGRRVFLLGAGQGVAETAGRRLQAMYPGLRIVGTYSPPMGALRRREDDRIVRMIRAANPDFLFVALGAPRQDLWIREHQHLLHVPVAMGVGCVLDLLAGSVKRAPHWMQRTGLEWAYRLAQEPTRLWRRYLVNDLPMLARLVCARPTGEPSEALAATS